MSETAKPPTNPSPLHGAPSGSPGAPIDEDQPRELPPGYNPSGCWPRNLIDANAVKAEAERAAAKKVAETPPETAPVTPAFEPILPEISYADWQKIDIRVGFVRSAERVPKSDKLLKLQVSFDGFERQILAGIGQSFTPDEVVGNRYLFLVNLAPRKMMGLESHGMMLAAGDGPDRLSLTKIYAPVGLRVG